MYICMNMCIYIYMYMNAAAALTNYSCVMRQRILGSSLQHQRSRSAGGPPIVPQYYDTACAIPELGYHQPHYQVQVR